MVYKIAAKMQELRLTLSKYPEAHRKMEIPPGPREELRKNLASSDILSSKVVARSFKFTIILLKEFLERLEDNSDRMKLEDIEIFTSNTSGRLRDELSLKCVYEIRENNVEYYDSARSKVGDKVPLAFPSSMDDIDEAGKCLAVERGTACAFHLMRALGPVLKVVARELGVTTHNPTWEAYLGKFDVQIEAKFPTESPSDVTNSVFYKDIKGHFYSVKDAHRNLTMHDIQPSTRQSKRKPCSMP